jgi:hypothetical protein
MFHLSKSPTSALGPSQPLMQCVRYSFRGVKLSGRKVHHFLHLASTFFHEMDSSSS